MSAESIAPCPWLDDQAEEADNPSGTPRASVMTVEYELAGTPFADAPGDARDEQAGHRRSEGRLHGQDKT